MNNQELSSMNELAKALQSSSVNILTGTPSCGKTSLSLNLAAQYGLHEGKTVAIFSFEHSTEDINQMFYGLWSNSHISKLSSSKLPEEERKQITNFINTLQASNIYINDNYVNSNFNTIDSECSKIIAKCGGIDLIIIDYLGLMVNVNKNIDETNTLIKKFDALAKKIKCPILLLFQLPVRRHGIPVDSTISKYNSCDGQWLLLRSDYNPTEAVNHADVFFLRGNNAGKVISFEFNQQACKFYPQGINE